MVQSGEGTADRGKTMCFYTFRDASVKKFDALKIEDNLRDGDGLSGQGFQSAATKWVFSTKTRGPRKAISCVE